jgi:dipeptidase D
MQGGHSGVDIAKHRANANIIMARLLNAGISAGAIRLMELDGGTGRNVIPRTCEARVACRSTEVAAIAGAMDASAAIIQKEYRGTEKDLELQIIEDGAIHAGCNGLTETDSTAAVDLLMALPSGPAEMDPHFPLLVQTSANLAIVKIEAESLKVLSSQRSSAPSRLDAICLSVESTGRLAGARAHTDAGYPSWPMNRNSPLLKRCTALYRELYATEPVVQIMHAGLECGVIGNRCPGMDMISLGPTLQNPHSPSERLHLPSVDKVWRLLVALLASFKD